MNRVVSEQLFAEQTANLSGVLLEARAWNIFELSYPVIDIGFDTHDAVSLRLKLNFSDWNDLPPTICLHNRDGGPLSPWPPSLSGVFNPGPHPNIGGPFVCTPGSREYHSHPSHTSDLWDNYRNRSGYDIGGILTELWWAWGNWKRAHT